MNAFDPEEFRREIEEEVARVSEPKGGNTSTGAGTGHNGHHERGPPEISVEIMRLAKLTALQYEKERKAAAEKFGIRTSVLDALVQIERNGNDDAKQGRAIEFPEPEPWPEPVNGAELLDGLARAIRAHVAMADAARDACALWITHTYLIDCFMVSPRLGVRSPTKGCGKTLLLDVLGCVVNRPMPTANVTPAAVFRVVESHRPTLLVDEADTFLKESDELRGVLNSGHRKGGQVLRTVGDDHEPRAFATFSACAIALIGTLPDTLHDRSVTIDLKRRMPSESVTPFRLDRAGHLTVLARKAARWAADHAERLADSDPAMPDGIVNREADNWRPLVAIADAAGGDWPRRARAAAQAAHAAAAGAEGRLELLLGDIRAAFGQEVEIASADLVTALVAIEGHPWAEYGRSGKPLTQSRLARMLAPLGIAPGRIGPRTERVRGYVRAHFEEAFARYLPSEGASKVSTRPQCDEMGTSEISKVSTPETAWTLRKCEKPNNDGLVDTWTLSKGEIPQNAHTPPQDEPPGTTARVPFMITQAMKAALRNRGFTEEGIARLTPERAHEIIATYEPGPVCTHCGKPGGHEVAFGDCIGTIRLHRECEDAWIERRVAEEGI